MKMFVSRNGIISLENGEFVTGFKKGGVPAPVFRYNGGSMVAQEKFVKASPKDFPESVLRQSAKDYRKTLIDDVAFRGERYGSDKEEIRAEIKRIKSMTDAEVICDYFHIE